MHRGVNRTRRVRTRVGAAVLSAVVATTLAAPAFAQQLAFPEAEGFGRFTTGGRGGDVYHVTNLNNSGAGSLRFGMDNAPSNGQGGKRTIVFDVGGVIKLTSLLVGQDNVTIAGQTAPGPGITVYSGNYSGDPYVGGRVSFTNANNSITRHVRFRTGARAADEADGLTVADGTDMIFDHLSVTWGKDETFSLNGSAGRITIQNTIVGQGLEPHSAGGLVQSDGGGISLLRNLYIDNNTRNVKANGIQQFTNNIVYNWGGSGGDGYIQGDTSAGSFVNAEGNYFINGRNTSSDKDAFVRGTSAFQIYARDNWQDSDKDGVLDGRLLTQADHGTGGRAVDWKTTPFDYPGVVTQSAQDAFAYVSKYVGPVIRDSVDAFLIDELESRGTKGSNIRHEFGLDGNGFVLFNQAPTPVYRPAGFDTDGDGMPNDWEIARGLNPDLATDRNLFGITGYTRLEEFLNEIGGIHPDKVWQSASGQWTEDAKWSAAGKPIFQDDTFVRAVNASMSGRVDVSGAASVSAFRLFIGGGTGPAQSEKVAVSGGALRVQDTIQVGYERGGALDITGGTVQAQNVILGYGPAVTGLGSTPVFSGTLTMTGGTLATSRVVAGGGTPTLGLSNGTLQAAANLTVNVPIILGAGVNTIDTDGFAATFGGAIGGSGALTKTGAGTADLTVAGSYTGGTFLKGGMLGISADDQLGPASKTPGAETGTLTFQGGVLRINGTTLKNLNANRPFDPNSFNGGFDVAAANNTFTVSQTLGGSGSLSKYGAGTLVLSGPNAHTGGTFLYGGMTSIAADTHLGANGGSISFVGGGLSVTGTAFTSLANHPLGGGALNGTVEIKDANNLFTIAQTITGTGSLVKTGAGTLQLSGANNTRNGTTDINGGTVRIGSDLALRMSTVILDTAGGKLDANGRSATLGGLSGNQPLDLKGVTLFIGNNNSTQAFSGIMSSSTGAGGYTKVGTGSFTPSGNNTYTGNTTAAKGILSVATINAPGVAGPLGQSSDTNSLVLDGGAFMYTGAGNLIANRGFSLGPAGGAIQAIGSAGVIEFTPVAGTIMGFVGAAGAHTLTLTGDKDARNRVNLIVGDDTRAGGGPTTLVKNGTGQWTIGNGNSLVYTGDTIINDGTLETITSTNPIPNGPGKGDLVIAPAGTFYTHSQNVTVNGLNDGTGGGGTIVSNNNDKSFTLGNGDASGAFSGTIAFGNNRLTKIGAGIQILSGTNSNTGTITVSAGVLQFDKLASMGGVTTQNMDVAQNATAAAGYAMDQAFLNRITPGSMGTAAVALNSANALSFLTPNLSLARLGAVGNVTYSGTLTPHGTTFRLGGGGGTLSIPNVLAGATNNLQVHGGGTVSLTAANSFGGIVTIGNGAFLSTNNLANGGANSGIGNSAAAASNLVLDGGTLRYAGGTASTNRAFTLGVLGGTIDASGTGSITFAAVGTPVAFSGTAGAHTLTLGGTNTARNTFGLSILDDTRTGTGKTSLAKVGTGMFVMSGVSTYGGGTNITAGTLVPAVNGSLGSGNVNVAAGAKLDLSSAGMTDAIAGTAVLSLAGVGAGAAKVDFQLKAYNELVGSLIVNGEYMPAGTYTNSNLNDYIDGSGSLVVAVPEPGAISLLLLPALALLRRRRLTSC